MEHNLSNSFEKRAWASISRQATCTTVISQLLVSQWSQQVQKLAQEFMLGGRGRHIFWWHHHSASTMSSIHFFIEDTTTPLSYRRPDTQGYASPIQHDDVGLIRPLIPHLCIATLRARKTAHTARGELAVGTWGHWATLGASPLLPYPFWDTRGWHIEAGQCLHHLQSNCPHQMKTDITEDIPTQTEVVTHISQYNRWTTLILTSRSRSHRVPACPVPFWKEGLWVLTRKQQTHFLTLPPADAVPTDPIDDSYPWIKL